MQSLFLAVATGVSGRCHRARQRRTRQARVEHAGTILFSDCRFNRFFTHRLTKPMTAWRPSPCPGWCWPWLGMAAKVMASFPYQTRMCGQIGDGFALCFKIQHLTQNCVIFIKTAQFNRCCGAKGTAPARHPVKHRGPTRVSSFAGSLSQSVAFRASLTLM